LADPSSTREGGTVTFFFFNVSGMNITKILADLRAEMAAIDEALIVLERLAQGRAGATRVGLPPGYKRRPFSEETRKKMAIAQRRRWAAYRKNKKTTTEQD
jgi:hypothetical protein